MSIKLKLVSCISAFILVLGIFIFGVLSAQQVTVNLGGSISFDATNVYARVTGRVQNAQVNPTLETLEFSADNDNPDQSSWSGLQLQFDSQATNITIEVTVENLSMERTLTVNLTDMIQTSTDNLSKTITLDGDSYLSGTNETIPVATSNDENNTSKVTFIITFDVIDHNKSLPNTNFDYDINLMDESETIIRDFEFELDEENHTATVTNYIGEEGVAVIPSSFSIRRLENGSTEYILGSDYTVTAIAAGTSSNGPFTSVQSTLTSITIPETIISIGNYAFYDCTMLTEINYNAKSANDLTVYNYVFGNAGRASEGITVNFGEGVEKVPAMLFRPSIASDVVEPNIIKVNFSSTITSIGANAFEDCHSLTSVTFGDNSKLTTIGSYAFSYCSSLTSIIIPEGVTSIGESAFDACYALAEVYNYSPSFTVPQGTSDSSVGYLGAYAKVVYNADDFTGEKPATRIKTVGNMQYYDDGSDFIALAPAIARDSLTTVSLDSRTTEINQAAFYHCYSLTSVTIPEGVTSIGERAFNSCYALAEVYNYSPSFTVPQGTSDSSVGYLGAYAKVVYNADDFTGEKPATRIKTVGNMQYYDDGSDFIALAPTLRKITEVTLDDRTTEIAQYAFYESDLTSITIGANVKIIGERAFQSCYRLNSVTINAVTPPTLGSRAMPSKVRNIYVPTESVSAYQSASGWSSYASIISAI